MSGVKWIRPVDEEPRQGELVAVTGPSGYGSKPFLAMAYLDDQYRPRRLGPPRLIDVMNNALSDHGWQPTHWARDIKLPESK